MPVCWTVRRTRQLLQPAGRYMTCLQKGIIMLVNDYFEKIQNILAEIAANPEPIQAAARLCASALAKGGVCHIFDSGHMVSSELINRAGGLVAFNRLEFTL